MYFSTIVVSVSCVGIRPKLNVDDFQDLLGAEGFNVPSKNKEPQTLSDMQDIGDLKKEQDPDRAKVKSPNKPHQNFILCCVCSCRLRLGPKGKRRTSELLSAHCISYCGREKLAGVKWECINWFSQKR